MAELIQDAQGKWKITQLILNVPTGCECNPEGLEIPAKYTYKGVEVSLSISNTAQTKQTQWKTKLGTAIRIDDIDRKYYDVTRREDTGWKTYKAYDNFSQSSDVKPFVATLDAKLGKSGFTSGSGSTTLSITSNTSWEITCDKSWVTIPVTAGTGNVRLDGIAVSKNTTLSARTATITITCSTGLKKTLTITQEAFLPNISITAPETISATATLLPYSATSNVDAVTVKCSNGQSANTKTGRFTISANTSTTEKTYIITAYCTNYPSYSATTTVTQSADGAVLSASCSNTRPGYQQTTATLTISSNVNWTISSESSWIIVSTPLTGTGNETRTVTFDANPTTSERIGYITVVGGGITREIEIKQDGAEPADTFDISAPGAMVPAAGGTVTLTITSNTSWTIESNKSWATLRKTSGTGNDTVVLTLAENTSDLRTVRISGTGGTATDYVDVKQEARGQLLPPEIDSVDISFEETGGKTPVDINYSFSANTGYGAMSISVELEHRRLEPANPIYTDEFNYTSGIHSGEIKHEGGQLPDFYVGSSFMFWLANPSHSTDLEVAYVYSDSTSMPDESEFTTWRIPISAVFHKITAEAGKRLYIRARPLQR